MAKHKHDVTPIMHLAMLAFGLLLIPVFLLSGGKASKATNVAAQQIEVVQSPSPSPTY